MKHHRQIQTLLAVLVGLLTGAVVAAAVDLTATTPNSASLKPGWGAWRPRAEVETAQFSAGFSNSELGGYLDFQAVCAETTKLPEAQLPIWFRLSNLVAQIGTGEVEFGCWVNGKLSHTIVNRAVRTDVPDVNCLRVNADRGQGLTIRREANARSRLVGVVANGKTVNPGTMPADIVAENGRNWLRIQAPVAGWVSVGLVGEHPNLSLCRR